MDNLVKGEQGTGQLVSSPKLKGLMKRVSKVTQKTGARGKNLQICFAFDTTGSMYPVFEIGRQTIAKVAQEISLGTDRPLFSFIAYKNHGDEGYFDHEKAFVMTPWTPYPSDIQSQMDKISKGGGGDGLTVLEDVLKHVAEVVEWDESKAKAMVLIGDMPPHGVVDSINRCPNRIDYRKQINALAKSEIAVYSVYCPTHNDFLESSDRISRIKRFYQEIAENTGGKALSLEDSDELITILTGICMKETNRLDEYIERLSRHKQLGVKEEKILKALK